MMRWLSALAAVLLFWGCNDKTPEEKIRPVRTIEMKQTTAISTHSFNGIARSDVAARLSFKVSGTVKSVPVHVGQKVAKGDIVAELDDTYFKLKVNEVKASLKQVSAKLANARSRYERIQKLYVERSSSLAELDNARTAKESAAASLKAMKNRLKQAELELSYTKLRAPIEGSVSDILVHAGENISPAVTVATISSTSSIEVPISVPGSLIANVKVGQHCTVKFDAIEYVSFDAEVVEVSHASNLRTTTFPVVVRLLDPSDKIRPGMSATVQLTFEDTSTDCNCFVIPMHALMQDAEGSYVYAVDNIDKTGIGVIKRYNVVPGELTTNGIVIEKGIREHMRVLTAGMHRVQENQRVRVER